MVYEEERRECKKISVGEVIVKKYIRDVIVGWYYSFIIHEKLYVNEKKKDVKRKRKKNTNEQEKDENER